MSASASDLQAALVLRSHEPSTASPRSHPRAISEFHGSIDAPHSMVFTTLAHQPIAHLLTLARALHALDLGTLATRALRLCHRALVVGNGSGILRCARGRCLVATGGYGCDGREGSGCAGRRRRDCDRRRVSERDARRDCGGVAAAAAPAFALNSAVAIALSLSYIYVGSTPALSSAEASFHRPRMCRPRGRSRDPQSWGR